ncbi:MAG: cytochrome c oxidase subunit II [Verrucomicrobia bacterium]|nr:cytochrome c oxidase subunit II [Verrucomicrobiota bacterium]
MNRVFIAQIQFFPNQASKVAGQVDTLLIFLVLLTGTVTLAIAVVMIYFLAKYRKRAAADRTPPKTENIAVEVTWSAVPFFIFLGLFGWGAKIYFKESTEPKGAVEVHVIGKQWMWKLEHLQGKREINQLHVPLGQTVKLVMTSEDVIHSFFLPAFRIKEDVLPGRYTTQWFKATKLGTYQIFCAQYCGTNHALMIGQVIVMNPTDFAAWLKTGRDTVSVAQRGEQLFHSFGCSGCHAAQAAVRAPLLEGIYDSQVPLADGRIVQADERYLRDCILIPNTQIVAGFDPVMPSFQGRISEDDLFAIITYLKSIGSSPPEANIPNR